MKQLFTIILIGICIACSFNKQMAIAPPRPASVPESAFWIGGHESGNWYVVHSVHDNRNNAIISVYGEDGELKVKKNFIVICRLDKPIVWINDLKFQINGYDGEKISLFAPTGEEICWMQ